ncbi:hypothetical protein [Pseudoalteromonas ruthenica]|uniref:hypothetical protein n=1 Tax=Pseudoalteromonas ruthenica TaxID=151081 RepID=UPI00110B26AD|nr:hypothetical protein [Pseudoalteromonas ruthenica]TMO86476.1 hypothetical protein CWC12_13745 [Pseudoalteromonas ruthenica]TMP21605.1 hypothetical protein CWC06_18045 [Pseudoalteromonas ruthenica]
MLSAYKKLKQRPPVFIPLLLALVLIIDSLISAPVFAIQWHSPMLMYRIGVVFSSVKLVLAGGLSAYLWWAIEKRSYRPLATIAAQAVMLMSALHGILLLVGMQSVIDKSKHYEQIGPYILAQQHNDNEPGYIQVLYVYCPKALGFYRLTEVQRQPGPPAMLLVKRDKQWFVQGTDHALPSPGEVCGQ